MQLRRASKSCEKSLFNDVIYFFKIWKFVYLKKKKQCKKLEILHFRFLLTFKYNVLHFLSSGLYPLQPFWWSSCQRSGCVHQCLPPLPPPVPRKTRNHLKRDWKRFLIMTIFFNFLACPIWWFSTYAGNANMINSKLTYMYNRHEHVLFADC